MRLRVEQVRRLHRGWPVSKRYPVSLVDGRATRSVYRLGETYAVQVAARGEAKARVTVTGRRRERLGEIDPAGLEREGCQSLAGFAGVWLAEHEVQWPPVRWAWCPSCPEAGGCSVCGDLGAVRRPVDVPEAEVLARFEQRHAHRQVWVLELEIERIDAVVWLAPAASPGGDELGYTDRPDLGLVDAGEVLDEAAVRQFTEKARVEHRRSKQGRKTVARDVGRRARQAVLHADPDAPQLAVIEQAVAELEEQANAGRAAA